jgi:hypothetical protein
MQTTPSVTLGRTPPPPLKNANALINNDLEERLSDGAIVLNACSNTSGITKSAVAIINYKRRPCKQRRR